MYYAKHNAYGSDTSAGFANTWAVVAFQSRKDRDAYCDNDNQGIQVATRRDARHIQRDDILVMEPDNSGCWVPISEARI